MTEPGRTRIAVGVGECRVAAFPTPSLDTYALGSCLGVMVYDWKQRLGGLLHVMLPDSSIDGHHPVKSPFLYVDTGVPELIRRFENRGGSRRRMRCCIAGGARMMTDPAQFRIGARNYAAIRAMLHDMRVFIDREDVGGTESRSVRLDLATGQIDLRKGSRPERVLLPPGIFLPGTAAEPRL